MIRVVELINSIDKRGGAEVFFANLCTELSKRDDIELIIVSLFDNIDSSFEFFKQSNFKFYSCHKRHKIDFKSSKYLRKIIKEFNPDIINTHLGTIASYFLAFGFEKRKWKIVHTVHSSAEKEATKFDLILRKPYLRNESLTFIAISDLVSKSILNLHPKAKITTIYNGVYFLKRENVNKDITFICPARYCEAKNHKLLFDVFNQYADVYQDSILECFGQGEIINDYKNYVGTLTHGQNIKLNGQVNNISNYLNRAKFFVLSSVYEGNPISVLEALSLGIPCVVPNVGGIPDVIKDGYNGFLFDVADEKSMLEKMFEATNYPDYKSLSKRCVESVSKYSISETARQYIDCFNELKGNR